MEHAEDGLFDNAAVTKWERGKAAEVLWKSGAKHRGMYALLISVALLQCHFLSSDPKVDMPTAFAKCQPLESLG